VPCSTLAETHKDAAAVPHRIVKQLSWIDISRFLSESRDQCCHDAVPAGTLAATFSIPRLSDLVYYVSHAVFVLCPRRFAAGPIQARRSIPGAPNASRTGSTAHGRKRVGRTAFESGLGRLSALLRNGRVSRFQIGKNRFRHTT
jgi:hypothetical protein